MTSKSLNPPAFVSNVVVVKDCALIVDSLEHPLNTLNAMANRFLGKVIDAREVQFSKTSSRIIVIFVGIVTDMKEV